MLKKIMKNYKIERLKNRKIEGYGYPGILVSHRGECDES
jgi:hypothetical protein